MWRIWIRISIQIHLYLSISLLIIFFLFIIFLFSINLLSPLKLSFFFFCRDNVMGENSFCSRTICWMEANSCLKLNLILISKMWKIFFCYFMANEGAKSPKQRKKYPTIHRGVKTPIQSLRKACPSWTAACSYTTIDTRPLLTYRTSKNVITRICFSIHMAHSNFLFYFYNE